MPWMEAERRLTRASPQIVRAIFDEMAARAMRQGAIPVFLALDIVSRAPEETPHALQSAADAGMLVFNLLDLWNGLDVDAVRIAKFDNHPNATGNVMIAERLADSIKRYSRELRLAP